MDHLPELLGITAAIALGAASPGPSFIMVAQASAGAGRRGGLLAALGMAVGGLVFAVLSLLGLHGLLSAVPSLYLALKVLGGLYLAYVGYRIFRGANLPLEEGAARTTEDGQRSGQHFLKGLATQLSNPKTAIVYASVFAAFLPADTTLSFKAAVACLVFAIEGGWYAIVASLFSARGPRRAYLRSKRWVDRAAGGIMIGLGLKLAVSGAK